MERPEGIVKLHGSVWQFHRPPDGMKEKMDIIFFHGSQLCDDAEAFWKTWLSRDEKVVWPMAWLSRDFPEARILSVSYDSSIRSSPGQMDPYLTLENLRQDLVWSCKVGQNCPVIFAGHCFGGILIKEFLITCCHFASSKKQEDPRVVVIEKFLRNCKGIFFYSTPNGGSRLMDGIAYTDHILGNVNQSIVDYLKVLSKETARINHEFGFMRRHRMPQLATRGIGETVETKLSNCKKTVIVPEASARNDVDFFYSAVNTDHFNVSRAVDDSTCYTFTGLRDLVKDVVPSSSEPKEFKSDLQFSNDGSYVPLINTVREVEAALKESQVVVLYGDSGMGKSSLAKYCALRFEKEHAHKAVSDGSENGESSMGPFVIFLLCGQGAKITSKQEELLIKSKATYPRQEWSTLAEATFQNLLLSKLNEHLKDREVLVILDDVWEKELVQNALVRGEKLRYLITTRNRQLWTSNAKVIKIEDMDLERGRLVFAKHAECTVQQVLEGQADELIKKVGCHPLALATLGLVFRTDRDWQELKSGFLLYLESDDNSDYPTLFDEGYPRSVYATMMLMVKGLDKDTKTVLYAINIFKGKRVPESLVKLFLSFTHSDVFERFRLSIRKLEHLGLVYREQEKSRMCTGGSHLPNVFHSEDDKDEYLCDVFVIHDLRRAFLSQDKSGTEKILSYFSVNGESVHYDPDMRYRYDLATALCATYVQDHVKRMAGADLVNTFLFPLWSWDDHYYIFDWIFLAVVKSMEEKTANATAAVEVLWTFVVQNEIKLDNITNLLGEPNFNRCAIEIVYVLLNKHWAIRGPRGSMVQFGDGFFQAQRFINPLSSNPGTLFQSTAFLCLLDSCFDFYYKELYYFYYPKLKDMFWGDVSDLVSGIADTNLLDKLFMYLDKKDGACGDKCFLTSLQILVNILRISPEHLLIPVRDTIVDNITRASNLHMLMDLVTQGSLQRPYNVQCLAVSILGGIAKWGEQMTDVVGGHVKNAMQNLFVKSHLFEAVLPYCFPPLSKMQTFTFPALSDGVPGLAMNLVVFAATHVPEMVLDDACIMKLMQYMDQGLSEWLEVIARAPRLAITVINQAGCLDKLAGMLKDIEDEQIQVNALKALYTLAYSSSRACYPRFEIQVRTLATEHLLKEIMNVLSVLPHTRFSCMQAAKLFLVLFTIEDPHALGHSTALIGSLESKAHRLETSVKEIEKLVVQEKSQVSGLTRLLSIARLDSMLTSSGVCSLAVVSAISDQLESAVTVLVSDLLGIAETAPFVHVSVEKSLELIVQFRFDRNLGLKDHMQKLATPGVLQKLATMLSKENITKTPPDSYKSAAGIVRHLATVPEIEELIGWFTDCGSVLVDRLLENLEVAEDVPYYFHETTVEVLIRLSVRDGVEARIWKLRLAPGTLARLYRRWAWKHVMQGDYRAALEDFNRALALEPDHKHWVPFLLQERGIVRRYLGDLVGALEDLDEALAMSRDDYECLKHRGLVKYKLNDEEGARKDADRAIEVRPSRVDDPSYHQRDKYDLCLGVQSVEFLHYRLK